MDPLERFAADARRAAEAVAALPPGSRWAVHCDTDADGLSAAAVACLALQAGGYTFQVHPSRDKTQAAYEAALRRGTDGHLFLDKGSSHLDILARGHRDIGRPVVVLDHHTIVGDVPEGVHLLNPRAAGLDGSHDACSSTTTLRFAVSLLGATAWRWAGVALVGAIGDWQHEGGWSGWNRRVVDEALARGHLEATQEPAYAGPGLADAITRRQAPDLPGLTGDAEATRAFLSGLRLDAEAEAGSLQPAEATRLVSGLVLHGLAKKVPPDDLRSVTHESLHAPGLGGLRQAFGAVDACGREASPATGIAYLMGDRAARDDAARHETRYRRTLTDAVQRLREDGPAARRALQHVAIDHPAYTGMVGGIGMTTVVQDKTRPMVVTAPRPDGDVQVSTRGTREQVEAGMDLGAACRDAGKAVRREGGGHPIAAGVVVAAGDLDAFLAALDEALSRQGFLPDL